MLRARGFPLPTLPRKRGRERGRSAFLTAHRDHQIAEGVDLGEDRKAVEQAPQVKF